MKKEVISGKLDRSLELLVKTAVPERSHFLYKKWLRYYLDFCQAYRFEPSKREKPSGF